MTADYVCVTEPADLFAKARELSVRTVPSVRVVAFTTNSARQPSAVASVAGTEVTYLASAQKPLRTAPFHGLPLPGRRGR